MKWITREGNGTHTVGAYARKGVQPKRKHTNFRKLTVVHLEAVAHR